MDLFSKLKKKNNSNEKGETVKEVGNAPKEPTPTTRDDDILDSIDALVDSDAEGADIFDDDDDEDDVGSTTHTGSIHSRASASGEPSPNSNYTEVVQNLATSPFLSPLAAKGDMSEGSLDLEITLTSRHSKHSASSKLSKDSIVRGLSGERIDETSAKSENHDNDNDSKTSQNDDRGSDSAEDYSDDEDEGQDGYKPGGYHPVKVGEVYNQRYVLIAFR